MSPLKFLLISAVISFAWMIGAAVCAFAKSRRHPHRLRQQPSPTAHGETLEQENSRYLAEIIDLTDRLTHLECWLAVRGIPVPERAAPSRAPGELERAFRSALARQPQQHGTAHVDCMFMAALRR